MHAHHPIALVTPSFANDFARCQLLVESVRRYARGPFRHYLLVDERDAALFATLAGTGTVVMTAESLLPDWLRRPADGDNYWLIRGQTRLPNWFTQQIVKLSFARTAAEPVILFVDSDVAFVRPFDAAPFFRGDSLRMFRVPDFQNAGHDAWHRFAFERLGLSGFHPGLPRPNYISNLISWRTDHVGALCRRLESVAGRPWTEVLATPHQFSEYILYGTFVEQVLGGERVAGHYYDARPLCHEYWLDQPLDRVGLAQFLRGLTPDHLAVMISARAGIDLDHLRTFVFDRKIETDGG